MIVTCRVASATPASFASHMIYRDSEGNIAAQYVADKNRDFFLGGGKRYFSKSLLEDRKANGYSLLSNYQELLDCEEARLLCDDERLTRGHAGYANDPGTVAKKANAFKESVAVVLDTAYRVKRLKPASNTVCCPTTLAVSASKRNP
ncbi:hypothetical protein DD238_007270 [Peronospora effusa]|uniref:Uncharacterized protein n=1 Tax=Peronospora effusa TaxID=542832 RepID=A0A3M6VA84_9STRA|nr:hypothetical protein DD238_007270 [Peronospora effusa]